MFLSATLKVCGGVGTRVMHDVATNSQSFQVGKVLQLIQSQLF